MLIISILLQRIYSVMTFCNYIICIYNHHNLYYSLLASYLCQMWICKLHFSLSKDIELYSGPKSNSCEKYWNLNSISAHNFSKVSLRFDIICLSETYLDSSILPHDLNLEVQGYDMIKVDHPSNIKRERICIY